MALDVKWNNGIIVLDDNGDVETVTGSDKLVQDILRELTTANGDDIFDSTRGATLNSSLIGVGLDPTTLISEIQGSIIRSLMSLKERQEQQAGRQYFSNAELIADIEEIRVIQDQTDPRQLNILISVLTRELTPLRIPLTFQVF